VTTVAVELVGPPGSGKSTLLAMLALQDTRVTHVDRARTLRRVPYLLCGAVNAAPLLLGERLAWQQIRWVTRVEAAALLVRRAEPSRMPAVVFAQGPVYSLARMSGASPVTPGLTAWRAAKVRQLGALLRLVVVLDAPNDVLLCRIRQRDKSHALQCLGSDSGRAAVARLRSALESTLAELTSDGGPDVLRFDTGRASPQEVLGSLLDTLRIREGL
jgi:hypothetical protein